MNIQGTYDMASAMKDIAERKQIIDNYRLTGFLDREDAIQKIQFLRLTDQEVAIATNVRLSFGSAPFSQVSDQVIISELQMQVEILSAKFLSNSI